MKDIILKVYLQPKSSKNEVVGPYRDGIKVKVTAPPVEGKANEALIRFLSKELNVSLSCIEILKGHHSREKTLRISKYKNWDFLKELELKNGT
ncbi:MAG: YggU family protein [Deltaproteobacteria bacterium RBG_16_47_11]|nr:MAG: YggU family protein [Deltaproteobacteria bacterium RBG_16_47_11]